MTYEERFDDLKRDENRELYDQPNLYEDSGLYEPTTFGERLDPTQPDDQGLYEDEPVADASEDAYLDESETAEEQQHFGETLGGENPDQQQSDQAEGDQAQGEQNQEDPGMLERAREKFDEWTDRDNRA